MIRLASVVLLSLCVNAAEAATTDRKALAETICATAELEARNNNIDPIFLARLLWRESLFDPNVVSYKGAQGIAQFMPETAKKRGLDDPFEPLSAVKASASFIADLLKQFGNLGLAAAAYNAGEKRVDDWQQAKGTLPLETQDYVQFITGRSADEWKIASVNFAIPEIGKGQSFQENCVALALKKSNLNGAAAKSVPRQPWGAVVAVNFNERIALSMFQRLKLRFPKVFANRDPMISRKKNLSRGTRRLVFVMLGENSASDAQATCNNLTALGAACIVKSN